MVLAALERARLQLVSESPHAAGQIRTLWWWYALLVRARRIDLTYAAASGTHVDAKPGK